MPLTRAPVFHSLRIADRRQETPDSVSIAFAVPAALRAAYQFTPGQYLTLRTLIDGADTRRSYSICAGLDDAELRVAIKAVPGGRFSSWAMATLNVGDAIDVMTPMGRFGAGALADGKNYVALVAGSGITPILSILQTVLTREPNSRFYLFYGNRSVAEIMFRTTLENLKDKNLTRLSVFHVLSREQQDVPALTGRLDAQRVRALLPVMPPLARIDQVFVCGPLAMIEDLPPALAQIGIAPTRIQVERFTPVPQTTPRPPEPIVAATAPRAMISAIHAGRRLDFPVHGDESLITAAQRAGLDLPFSCQGGMCCTCRAKVLQGTVNMAVNYSLEPWETAAGFVLTCQARPTTTHLVVDYDAV